MITRYTQRNLTWIDLVTPSAPEIRSIMAEFDLDPILAEELSSPSPKSRAEKRGHLLFIVLHFPALRTLHSRPEHEIDFIVGKDFLITTRYANIDPLHSFAKAFEVDAVLSRSHADHGGHLFVGMVRDLYRSLLIESDRLHERLDTIENRIFAGREKEMVAEISSTGRIIHDFRRTLQPHTAMLESIEPHGAQLFGQGFAYHLRSLLGEQARVQHTLEHLREWLDELRETNNSLLTTKQNEIMKILTIMAFVTFPLTLVSSIFGMNTDFIPLVGLPGDFWMVIGIMLALMSGFFIYFKSKHWL